MGLTQLGLVLLGLLPAVMATHFRGMVITFNPITQPQNGNDTVSNLDQLDLFRLHAEIKMH